jgi:hypothetical protein
VQVAGRGIGVVQHEVDGGAHDGQRGAQFVRGVGDEPLLALECGLEPAEHLVEGLGQFAEFVAGPVGATRADRLCPDAARAAVVIWCTGRSARPEKIQPRTAARAMTTATVIDASVTGGPDPGQPDFSARLSDLSAA